MFGNKFGFGNKYLGFNRVRSLYNLTLTRGQAPPRPPVRTLYYLTLTLTLKIIIGFEYKFGFEHKHLGHNQVRSLYNLTRGQAPQTPHLFPVLPNPNT